MSVYTCNLRVFWTLCVCVLTAFGVLHYAALILSFGHKSDPGEHPEVEWRWDGGAPVLILLLKLFLAATLCFLFFRYCSTHPRRAEKSPGLADTFLRADTSRQKLLEDYYNRWVRLSPHMVGHSKANVAKVIVDLIKAGRTYIPPESSLAFRGDFLQVGSAYEEHKVGSPDCFDILVPLRVPSGLKLQPRVIWGVEDEEPAKKSEEQCKEDAVWKREEDKGECKQKLACTVKRKKSKEKKHKSMPRTEAALGKKAARKEDKEMEKEEGVILNQLNNNDKDMSGLVPQCFLEVPVHGEWVRRHRAFVETFLQLPPQDSSRGGSSGSKAYRFTTVPVLRWFFLAVQRCLSTVRYSHEQHCTFSLTMSNDCVQLHLTQRPDYICCHISMVIRMVPALLLGNGIYLVPTDTTSNLDHSTKSSGHKDLWTLYFPNHEQRLLSWQRGCVPQSSCHLKCLQLVKAIRDLGAQALDNQGSEVWRTVLSSYVLKTAWMRLLLSLPPEAWEEGNLVARVEDLIWFLKEALEKQAIAHLFLGGDSETSVLSDSLVFSKLVKDGVAVGHRASGRNLWAGIQPMYLDMVSGRLAYAWTHLHRLIRLTRPQRSCGEVGRPGHGHIWR